PSSISSTCRRTSNWIAFSMKRKLLRFLISQRVPSASSPARRTDTLASQRKLPSCMLPSQMSIQRAGAVQVDAGHAAEVLVQRLAGILLEVRTREPHRLLRVADHEFDAAALHDGNLVLRD